MNKDILIRYLYKGPSGQIGEIEGTISSLNQFKVDKYDLFDIIQINFKEKQTGYDCDITIPAYKNYKYDLSNYLKEKSDKIESIIIAYEDDYVDGLPPVYSKCGLVKITFKIEGDIIDLVDNYTVTLDSHYLFGKSISTYGFYYDEYCKWDDFFVKLEDDLIVIKGNIHNGISDFRGSILEVDPEEKESLTKEKKFKIDLGEAMNIYILLLMLNKSMYSIYAYPGNPSKFFIHQNIFSIDILKNLERIKKEKA